MVINFSNTLDERMVQEMIDAALSGLTISGGLVNLSTASAGEIISACTDDSTIFSINYSGKTYTEQYRESSGDSLYVYFYVIGAQADEPAYEIYDAVRRATINANTGAVSIGNIPDSYAANIYYDLDRMNQSQIDVFAERLYNIFKYKNSFFTAAWTYDNKRFIYALSHGINQNRTIIGIYTAFDDDQGIVFDSLRAAISVLQHKVILQHDISYGSMTFTWPE